MRLYNKDKEWCLQSDSEYDSELTESDVEPKLSLADKWAARLLDESTARSRQNRSRRAPIHKELRMYREIITTKPFTATEARNFWLKSWKSKSLPRLCAVARLLMNISASAIEQERHFSELKRLITGVRSLNKVGPLDRDAVVFSWFPES